MGQFIDSLNPIQKANLELVTKEVKENFEDPKVQASILS